MSAIHIKSPALTLRAGPRALARIRQHGLSPAEIRAGQDEVIALIQTITGGRS